MAAPMEKNSEDNFFGENDKIWKVSSENSVYLAMYEEVENCKELKQLAIAGEIEGVLLNPAMIVNPFQVLVACKKAVHNQNIKKMVTKKLQTEVLYCLSATKNISDSLVKFGITDHQRSVLLAVISSPEQIMADADKTAEKIEGQKVELKSIGKYTDEKLIRKVYKVKDPELDVGTLLDAVVGRIASKDFVSF